MKKILGISAYYHDAAAALLVDGNIIAAAQEERFNRIKHTADFPAHAIRYCLDEGKIQPDELDAVVFYDKPLLKFERLMQTYAAFAPRGLISFAQSIPSWLDEKLFLKNRIYKKLKEAGFRERKKIKLLFSEHHLSHAASTFYASTFEHAAILTVDGVGEWCTASVGVGEKGNIRILKEMEFPHSAGLLYSAFTYYLGFEVNNGEYKLMGLAPYGISDSEETKKFISVIKEKMIDLKPDGSVWLNQELFRYSTGLKMTNDKAWKNLFGVERRNPDEELKQVHCNLAFAIQSVMEEIILKMAAEARRITGEEKLCMAGGVALNCVANGKLLKSGLFKNLFIQPAAGDAGGAIGAALAVHHLYFNEMRTSGNEDLMQGSFLGPRFTDFEIEAMNKKFNAVSKCYESFHELTHFIAFEISQGKTIGWFQGRMEFGPRALGNRSILADPRNSGMQKHLNQEIKFRESFRPFAPAVLAERVSDYFEMENDSPFMLFTAPTVISMRENLPDNFSRFSMAEKLNFKRSKLPAVTHIDFTSRVQTVSHKTHARFHELISAFEKQTGCAVLLNTSFNVKNEPIVCSPEDAYRCFMNTGLDYLVIENFVYSKPEQPSSKKNERNKTI